MVHHYEDDSYHEVGWGGPEDCQVAHALSAHASAHPDVSDSAFITHQLPLYD